jgi:hypothetical protein
MAPVASYVLPIRCGPEVPAADLTGYLDWLAGRVEVVVVDGSAPPAFAAHARLWRGLPLRHVAPDPELDGANGKVVGVVTGLRLASHDRVVIADDDVRYGAGDLERTISLLDCAELVSPQNYFSPRPWHATWDSARSLVNRIFGGDYPGTLAVRRSFVLAIGGYDGDVLFENLELMRTVRAAGGRVIRPLDLYVARRPPPAGKFWSQRVRQAYDDFAQPLRLVAALSAAPALVATARRSRRPWLPIAGASVAAMVTAEAGRRRAGGRRFFPVKASLLAPMWVLERALCSWLAVAVRLRHGGCPYAGRVVPRAAHSERVLRNRVNRTPRPDDPSRSSPPPSATRAEHRQPVEAAPTSIPR